MKTLIMDDRAQIAVRELPGDGTPVLFLHDLDCDGTYWTAVVRRLKELAPDARILIPDLRGHGASSTGEAPSRKRLVKDCKRLCKELGSDAPLVVGHGIGADIALAFEDAGAVVAINPRMGRSDEVLYTEEVQRPDDLSGTVDQAAAQAFRIGLDAAKPLRRTKRDAPVLLVASDPDDMEALLGTDVLEQAADVYGIQLASRHLPIEMPSAIAALVCMWLEEAL